MAMNKKQMGAMKEKQSGGMAKEQGTPPNTGFKQSTNGMGSMDVGMGHKPLGKISTHHDSKNFSNQTLSQQKEAPVKESSEAGLKPFKNGAGPSVGDNEEYD